MATSFAYEDGEPRATSFAYEDEEPRAAFSLTSYHDDEPRAAFSQSEPDPQFKVFGQTGDDNPPSFATQQPTPMKTAVMMLNERYPGLHFTMVDKSGPDNRPTFKMQVVVDGVTFNGEGSSKNEAKLRTAEAALKCCSLLTELVKDTTQVVLPDSFALAHVKRTAEDESEDPPRKKTKPYAKNAVMLLNELKPGLQFVVVEKCGPENRPVFKMQVEVNGVKFDGEGSSKNAAKLQAADKAIVHLQSSHSDATESNGAGGDNANIKIPRNAKKALILLNGLNPELHFELVEKSGPDNQPIFKMEVEVDGVKYQGEGSTKEAAKLQAAEKALKPVQTLSDTLKHLLLIDCEPPKADSSDSTATAPAPPAAKNPVQLLNEVRQDLEYECVEESGQAHNKQFLMSVRVDEDRFEGSGGTKRLAKMAAALAALDHIFKFQLLDADTAAKCRCYDRVIQIRKKATAAEAIARAKLAASLEIID